MGGVLLAQAQSVDFSSIVGMLSTASPIVMLAVFIVALATKKLVLPRELSDRDKRIAQLEAEIVERTGKLEAELDQYKRLALGALAIGERTTSVIEGRERHR